MKLKDAEKEKRIMQATREIVHEKGLVGVKMTAVAKKAGIAPSNVYIYFKNKEDLLENTFFDGFRNSVALTFRENAIRDDIPFKHKVQLHFEVLIKAKLSLRMEFSFFRQYMQSIYFKKELHRSVDSIAEPFFKLFGQGQKEMIIKDDIEMNLILALIDGMSDKLIELHDSKRINLDDELIEKSFKLIWDALRQ